MVEVGLGAESIPSALLDGHGVLKAPDAIEMTGALSMRSWDPGSGVGDLDDDPAAALAAAPEGRNLGGFFMNVTIEPAGDSWRYIVNLSSACAAL